MTSGTDSRVPVFAPVPAKGTIGRYELVERLATGGMAEIYLARESKGLDRLVVIKKILPHLAVHEQFVDMFLQEARLISRLAHPNVVQIYELGEDQNTFFIAMEYVPGASLRELMRTAALTDVEVPIGVAVSLVVQGCDGAHAAHNLKGPDGKSLGVVHRDISPHNLMVTSAGHVKLLDFGIAKATEIAAEQTRTGALKGKVHYMSPEQCRQEPLDRRSDVFALGIVLWELLTARRLFKRDSDLASMQAIVTGDVWNAQDFRKDLPDKLSAAVHKAICVERADRYESADAMRRALIEAAEADGFRVSADVIAPFVGSVLGERLEKMKHSLEDLDERTVSDQSVSAPSGEATLVDRHGRRSEPGIHDAPTAVDGDPVHTLTGTETRATMVQAPAKSGRRRGLAAMIGLGVIAAALAVGFFLTRPPAIEGPPLVLGFAPTIDPEVLREDIEPLRAWVETRTRRPIDVVIAESYEDLANRLLRGEVHFASLPPNLYLETEARSSKIKPIAFKLFAGAAGSDGYIFARDDVEVRTVADIKGKTFCYPDEKSTTGYKLPMRALRRAGITVIKDIRLKRSGNHTQVLRDVLEGRCEVGATYSGNFLSAGEAGVNVARLQLVTTTGRVPQDAVTAGPEVSDRDRELFQRTLLGFDAKRDLGIPFVGRTEKITGFAPGSEGEYTALRRLLAEEGAGNASPEASSADAGSQ
jgi:phosphate/phosphite/phosphonate ABC transporter binding protein